MPLGAKEEPRVTRAATYLLGAIGDARVGGCDLDWLLGSGESPNPNMVNLPEFKGRPKTAGGRVHAVPRAPWPRPGSSASSH